MNSKIKHLGDKEDTSQRTDKKNALKKDCILRRNKSGNKPQRATETKKSEKRSKRDDTHAHTFIKLMSCEKIRSVENTSYNHQCEQICLRIKMTETCGTSIPPVPIHLNNPRRCAKFRQFHKLFTRPHTSMNSSEQIYTQFSHLPELYPIQSFAKMIQFQVSRVVSGLKK